MGKRPHGDSGSRDQAHHKKQRHESDFRPSRSHERSNRGNDERGYHDRSHSNTGNANGGPTKLSQSSPLTTTPVPSLSYREAFDQLPPEQSKLANIQFVSHTDELKEPSQLPSLPQVHADYAAAPFRHKSQHHHGRDIVNNDMTYERLEFLGDAYLELCASRLIFSRFNHLPAGQMSQLRELLVKNETLAEYSRAYGFLERLSVGDREKMERDSKGKGNKGLNKVLGDVFEAYVAAVVLSDDQNGYAVVEKWLSELWAPKLLGAARSDKLYGMRMAKHEDQPSNPEQIYDPEAKGKLQRRVTMNNMIKLDYEAWKPTVELKGDKIGQNVHYIALYFTGFEYEKKLLAKGEGKNKVEAGNWAAMDAMYGSSKEFVEEMEQRVAAEKERRKKMK